MPEKEPEPTVEAWAAFVGERRLGVVATVSADGTPHAVPVEVLVREGRVYVWCKSRSRKALNAEREGKAALVAYKSHHGVLVRGPVRILRSGDDGYAETTRGFLDKYEREETYGNDTLIEIEPKTVVAF